MKQILFSMLMQAVMLGAEETPTPPKPEPVPQLSEEAKKAEVEKNLAKMERERATRPPADTRPAQVKNEDPRVRMDRLKEESQAAGDTEAQRVQRYRLAREQAEAEQAAEKEKEAQQKAKPVIASPQK